LRHADIKPSFLNDHPREHIRKKVKTAWGKFVKGATTNAAPVEQLPAWRFQFGEARKNAPTMRSYGSQARPKSMRIGVVPNPNLFMPGSSQSEGLFVHVPANNNGRTNRVVQQRIDLQKNLKMEELRRKNEQHKLKQQQQLAQNQAIQEHLFQRKTTKSKKQFGKTIKHPDQGRLDAGMGDVPSWRDALAKSPHSPYPRGL
jgi:hypothetical protein